MRPKPIATSAADEIHHAGNGKVDLVVDGKRHRLEPGSGVIIAGRKYLVGKRGQLLRLDKHARRQVH